MARRWRGDPAGRVAVGARGARPRDRWRPSPSAHRARLGDAAAAGHCSCAPVFHICELTWTLVCAILDVWRRGAVGGLILGVVVKTVTSLTRE